MRKWILSLVLASGISGCTSINGVNTIDPNFIASVQSIASTACAIIPTVESIVAIFNAGIATTAQTISSVICSAVPPKASAKFKSLPLRGMNGPAPIGVIPGTNITVTGWRA